MSWKWAALMPHPPIIVPEVGRGREQEAAETLRGAEELGMLLANRRPEVLLLLSPHQPYAPGAFFINGAPRLAGSLAPFGASSVTFDLETPTAKVQPLAEHLATRGFAVRVGESPDLTHDQGSLVPLYFLRRAWEGAPLPPVVLASPIGLDMQSALKLGEELAAFEDDAEWALLASGDLSHRLTRDAPAGYSPVGKMFDAAAVDALSSLSPQPLFDLNAEDMEEAGECGLRSIMAMLGLCRTFGGLCEVLSYEGPFGVGYSNALWLHPSEIAKEVFP